MVTFHKNKDLAKLPQVCGQFLRPTKTEFPEEGPVFPNRFPSLRNFVTKKVGIRKN